MSLVKMMDQKLIPYRFLYCFSCSCWGDAAQKSLRLRRFKSDRDDIWQDCSSSKYALVDGVGVLIMTSYVQDGGDDVILPPPATAVT